MRISPSKLQPWVTCPCFEYVEQTSTTDEGQRLHAAMETDNDDLLETEEEFKAVLDMRQYRNSVSMAVCGKPVDLVIRMPKRSTVPVEPVWQARELEVQCGFGITGTLDQVFVNLPRAAIIDWKTGRLGLPTDAQDNRQQQAYALGLWNLLPDLDEIETHLMNPRTSEADSCCYQRPRRPEMQDDLQALIAKVDDPFKQPCDRDPDICGRCANAHRCPLVCKSLEPARSSLSIEAVKEALSGDVTLMSKAQQGDALLLTKLALEFFEQRKQQIVGLAVESGEPPEGFTLVQKPGVSSITDLRSARAILRSRGVEESVIDDCSSLSLAKLKRAVDKVEQLLAPVVQQGPAIQYLMKKSRSKKAQQLGA